MPVERTHPTRRPPRLLRALALIAPGMLVAATGVGAGDFASAGFAGAMLGPSILWAVVVGAAMKYALTEGLARWQIATGTTILEGAAARLGRWSVVLFLVYFIPWSYFTCVALLSAIGTAGASVLPLTGDPSTDKLVHAAAHSGAALALVWIGGFKVFERVMAVGVALMFVTVLLTAWMVGPDWSAAARGLFVPTLPRDQQSLAWTVALIGGVGGTVTILCYGYWIREIGRTSPDDLGSCRIDLGSGYLLTALFGIAMILIATGAQVEGKGTNLILGLADRIEPEVGPTGRAIFLAGTWAAIFSSVLGVWQAVPYLFADIMRALRRTASSEEPLTSTRAYRGSMLAIASIPLLGVAYGNLKEAQLVYTIVGSLFLPALALALLVMNGRASWVGRFRSGPMGTLVLIITIVFFVLAGYLKLA